MDKFKAMINEPYDVTEKRRAEEIQEQAAAIRNVKRPDGRYSIGDAIVLLLAETGDYFPLHKAVESGDIPCYQHDTGDKKGDPKDQRSYICWDDLNKWIIEKTDIRKFRFPEPDAPAAKVEAAPVATPGNDDVSTENLVYWRAVLRSNIKKIDNPTKAGVRKIIKYLRDLGDARLPNEGTPDELFWKDDVGNKQRVQKKTVSNAANDARKLP